MGDAGSGADRQEGAELLVGGRVIRMATELGLNRPEAAIVGLSEEIDALIGCGRWSLERTSCGTSAQRQTCLSLAWYSGWV
jgi:hypothetical protein